MLTSDLQRRFAFSFGRNVDTTASDKQLEGQFVTAFDCGDELIMIEVLQTHGSQFFPGFEG